MSDHPINSPTSRKEGSIANMFKKNLNVVKEKAKEAKEKLEEKAKEAKEKLEEKAKEAKEKLTNQFVGKKDDSDNNKHLLLHVSTASSLPPSIPPMSDSPPGTPRQLDAPQINEEEEDWTVLDFPKSEIKKEFENANPVEDVEYSVLSNRIRAFIQKYDARRIFRVHHLTVWTMSNSEVLLNSRLNKRFGQGLAVARRRKSNGTESVGNVSAAPRTSVRTSVKGGEVALLDEAKKEELRVFLNSINKHDLSHAEMESQIADIIASASAWTLNEELKKRFGKNLDTMNAEFDRLDRMMGGGNNNKQGSFIEVPLEDEASGNKKLQRDGSFSVLSVVDAPIYSTGVDEIGNGNIRADLEAFYIKHDPSKLIPTKFEPIVTWALKIGYAEIDLKFAAKYAESLSQMIEAARKGLAGAPPWCQTHNSDMKTVKMDGCDQYREGVPGKGFGVCGNCGLSRVDHLQDDLSLFVPGNFVPVRPARSQVGLC